MYDVLKSDACGGTYFTLLSLERLRLGLSELLEPSGMNPIGMLLTFSCSHKTSIRGTFAVC